MHCNKHICHTKSHKQFTRISNFRPSFSIDPISISLTPYYHLASHRHQIMSKKNLFICFDAFGTLFTPRKPVAQQYSEVARTFGLGGFSDDDIAKSFKEGTNILLFHYHRTVS
jgi:hypothetical protein